MKPISWHKDEQLLSGGENIDVLPVVTGTFNDGTNIIVSCWKPTVKDIWQILINRRIYLSVMGRNQPPVSVASSSNDFGIDLDEQ